MWISSHLSLAVSQGPEEPGTRTTSRARRAQCQAAEGALFISPLDIWKITPTSPQGYGHPFIWIIRLWSDFMIPQHHQSLGISTHMTQKHTGVQRYQQYRQWVGVRNPSAPFPDNCPPSSVSARLGESSAAAGLSYLSGWWPPRSCTWGAGSLWGRGCHPCAPGRSSGSLGADTGG